MDNSNSNESALPDEMPDEWISMMAGNQSRIIRDASIIRIDEDSAWFDIHSKFESKIPLSDWGDEPLPQVGDQYCIIIDDDLAVNDRPLRIIRVEVHCTPAIPDWENIINTIAVGDSHSGRIARKLPGGFLIDIGVNVVLPNDCATPAMLANEDDFIGQQIDVCVTNIDDARRNIRVKMG